MIVTVIFGQNGYKKYRYNTDIKMCVNGIYDITTDGGYTYSTYVKVVDIKNGSDKSLRTIYEAKLISAPKRPKPYKKIVVNEEKETVCVLWLDGTRTVMKPQPGDVFDFEKGIAMCFMKKCFDNRGCFNEAFRDLSES